MAERDGAERKVWILPTELVERLKSFQADQGIASEVEAARRLLDSALQMRDSISDVLRKLKNRYGEERDLRVLARDVLFNHPLVSRVDFADRHVSFEFKEGGFGRIDSTGSTFLGQLSDEYGHNVQWTEFPKVTQPTPRSSPKWDAPRGGDLDDEIPF